MNAAQNGITTAQALANGRWLDAAEAATLTIENAAGAYGGAKALFAKPRVVSAPTDGCFVAGTTVKCIESRPIMG